MPKKAPIIKPERPIPRPLFNSGLPGWVIFDPARLAPVGGSIFALLALCFYAFRHWRGAAIPGLSVVVGVFLTFVVGYAATGIFVYWLLWVVNRELPEEIPDDEDESGAEEEEGLEAGAPVEDEDITPVP